MLPDVQSVASNLKHARFSQTELKYAFKRCSGEGCTFEGITE